jgi:hypothetical protein
MRPVLLPALELPPVPPNSPQFLSQAPPQRQEQTQPLAWQNFLHRLLQVWRCRSRPCTSRRPRTGKTAP